MSDTPVPPPHGWTLTEAATALDPDGWREANFGEDAWAADPAAAEAARERHIVRFARTMEVSKHLPTRAVQVKPSGDGTLVALEDHIWSIARPRLAFDFYPPLPGGLSGIGGPRFNSIVLQDGRVFSGVRIHAAAPCPPGSTDRATRAAQLERTMRVFLTAFKMGRGFVCKRDEAISAFMKLEACTFREAAAAFEAAPHPELRNSPPAERGKGESG